MLIFSSDDFPPQAPLLRSVSCNQVYIHILHCEYMFNTDAMEDICDDGSVVPYISCSKYYRIGTYYIFFAVFIYLMTCAFAVLYVCTHVMLLLSMVLVCKIRISEYCACLF